MTSRSYYNKEAKTAHCPDKLYSVYLDLDTCTFSEPAT